MPSSEELERKIQDSCKEGAKDAQRRAKERCAVCGRPAHPDPHKQGW